jgi:hypothetical protein
MDTLMVDIQFRLKFLATSRPSVLIGQIGGIGIEALNPAAQ